VLIGRQGSEEITADEMADQIGTISYEVFTRISERVPRLYLGEAAGSGGWLGAEHSNVAK